MAASSAQHVRDGGRVSAETRAKRDEIIGKFIRFDTNGDGSIDIAELRNVLCRLHPGWSEERLARLFSVIDTDGSGRIDYREFVAWAYGPSRVRVRDLEDFRADVGALAPARVKGERTQNPAQHRREGSRRPSVEDITQSLEDRIVGQRATAAPSREGVARGGGDDDRRHASSLPPASQDSTPADGGRLPLPRRASLGTGAAAGAAAAAASPAAVAAGAPSSAPEPCPAGPSASAAPPVGGPPEAAPASGTMAAVDVRVTGMSGQVVAAIPSADVGGASAAALRRQVADAAGFPASALQLLLPSGECFGDRALECMQPELCPQGILDLTCVVRSENVPVGSKRELNDFRRTKGNLIVARRLDGLLKDKKAEHVRTERNPSDSERAEATILLQSCFSEGVAEFIEFGVKSSCEAAADNGHAVRAFYETTDGDGVCVDMSECRLWTRSWSEESFQEHRGLLDRIVRNQHFYYRARDNEEPPTPPGRLVSAVLWRILHGWEGCSDAAAGPILEVLFMATAASMRETMQARQLQEELEEAARALGCTAICVAAVPHQGKRFWSATCGFETFVEMVPNEGSDGSDGGAGLEEPTHPLGVFLRNSMCLFDDTPLLAKVLRAGAPSGPAPAAVLA